MNLIQISIIIIVFCILIFYTIPITKTKSSIENFADYYPTLTNGTCRTARGNDFYSQWKALKKNNDTECKTECDNDPLCDGYAYYNASTTSNNCQLFNANYTISKYPLQGSDTSYSDIVRKSDSVNGGLGNNNWNCNIKKKSYRFYKWVVTDVRGGASPLVVGNILFYNIQKSEVKPNKIIGSYYNANNPPANYPTNSPYKTASNILVDYNGPYHPINNTLKDIDNKFGGILYFDFGKDAPRIEYFDWITTNEDSKYDPIWWSLYGTNDDLTTLSGYNNNNTTYNENLYGDPIKWDLLHYQDPYIISGCDTSQIINNTTVPGTTSTTTPGTTSTTNKKDFISKRLEILKKEIPSGRGISASNGKLFELTYPNCSCPKRTEEIVIPPTQPPPTQPPQPSIGICNDNESLTKLFKKLSDIKNIVTGVDTYYIDLKQNVDQLPYFVLSGGAFGDIKKNIDTNNTSIDSYKSGLESLLRDNDTLMLRLKHIQKSASTV